MKTSRPLLWTGHLQHSEAGYVGELRDEFGWPIWLTAEIEEKDGKRRFRIKGITGPPPPALRIAGLDDEAPA